MTYGRPTKLKLRKIIDRKVQTEFVQFNTRSEAIDKIPLYEAMPDVECITIEEELI